MEHINEECQCEGKKCTKCKDILCIGRFTKDKRLQGGGLRAKCKDCSNLENKEWRERNSEYNIARVRAWQDTNLKHVNETRRNLRSSRLGHFREMDIRNY